MTEKKKIFIQKYVDLLENEIKLYEDLTIDEQILFDTIFEIKGIFSEEFPELEKSLSFNNGTAMRDARILLGLLNKKLTEEYIVIEKNQQAKILDIINQLKLEIGSLRNIVSSWTKEWNITKYCEQLEKVLQEKDIKSIKYCLLQIQEWYNQNIDKILNSDFCINKAEQKSNFEKINRFIEILDEVPEDFVFENTVKNLSCQKSNNQIIFISHSSSDKKYGEALRKFIIGLGVEDRQLIYTSHPLNGIPMDKNIYDYLRENFDSKVFMIILWSDTYLESPACLNEMGAAWITQSDYTNIYVPSFSFASFSFGNPKYHECAVDTRKMGAVLKNDGHCKTKMIELKNKIIDMFNLRIDEKHFAVLLEDFIKDIE